MVEKLSYEDLLREYSAKGLSIKDLPVTKVLNGQKTANPSAFDEFTRSFESGMFSYVIVADEYVVGRLKTTAVVRDELDLGALNTDFAQLLNDNDIKIDNLYMDINPVTVKRFNYDLILQLAVLGAIIFLVFNILRGMSGGGKGLMQFGQSKAKIFFGRKPDVTFKDVAGVDSAKEELEEVVMFLKDPKRFTKLGARIPKGLLMVGSPGTGKTLLARAIAGEAGVPFFHTSGSEFEEMLVGAGASRVRDLFEKAKKAAPALVFIDEIDAVARKRGTTVQSSTTEQTLNQILVEMDGFEKNANVIVIAATNRPDVLDPAILRPGRFDRRIVIEIPDIKGREDILKIHSKNKPLADDVSITKVARRTIGYSGADLENLLNEAAIIVAKDNRNEIRFNDIEEAANRVTMGRERRIERDEEELKKTAYHEAGHAIVAKLTPESDPVHRITIISRGMALGVTMQLPEKDKYSQSFTEMQSRLRVLMAGRAAEEIIYGEEKITSGASNDIEKATGIARRMVKSFGFSKKIGMVKHGESNELQYLGYGYGEQRDYSDDTAKIIDEEVKRIIDEAYKDAVRILTENRQILEKISDDLIEREVLEAEDFEKYFE
jgi:cell division protease FtsH